MNIRIYSNDKKYVISWALNEDFTEIKGKIFEPFMLTAEFLENNWADDFTLRSKILLSAIAGAVIQHLIDICEDLSLKWKFVCV